MKELEPEQKERLGNLSKHVITPLLGVLAARWIYVHKSGIHTHLQMYKNKGYKFGVSDEKGTREASGQMNEDGTFTVDQSTLSEDDERIVGDHLSGYPE